jgi:hypothetical protein
MFPARAIAFNSVAYLLLVARPTIESCSKKKSASNVLSYSPTLAGCFNPFKLGASTTGMKTFLAFFTGILSIIMATQLIGITVEQFAPAFPGNCTENIENYTPPNLGGPDRSLGSATR